MDKTDWKHGTGPLSCHLHVSELALEIRGHHDKQAPLFIAAFLDPAPALLKQVAEGAEVGDRQYPKTIRREKQEIRALLYRRLCSIGAQE